MTRVNEPCSFTTKFVEAVVSEFVLIDRAHETGRDFILQVPCWEEPAPSDEHTCASLEVVLPKSAKDVREFKMHWLAMLLALRETLTETVFSRSTKRLVMQPECGQKNCRHRWQGAVRR